MPRNIQEVVIDVKEQEIAKEEGRNSQGFSPNIVEEDGPSSVIHNE